MVAAEVSHAPANNAAAWREALEGNKSVPENYLLTKTLVFKPKVAKTETATLIVVVALDNTATSAAQAAKAAGEKDARSATPEAVKEALGVTSEQGFPF